MSGLTALGVSDDQLRLYRYFLRHPGHETEEAAAAFGLEPDALERALTDLQEKGLLRVSGRHTVLVSDPAVAVEWLVERELGALKLAGDQVAAARKAIPALAEEHKHGLAETPVGDIERVDGVDAIRERLTELGFFTFRELMALLPGRWQPESIAQARESDLRMLRRGIRWRTVAGPEAAGDPDTLAYLRELVALGAEVRVTDQAIRRMVVWDRTTAMVPVDPDDYLQATLVIRQGGVVANTVAWFEQVWSNGLDLPAATADAPAPAPLSPLERRVLDVLARTDKDETAAREMGVSLRTFRRYIADLMQRLGAANRFQAGLMAKEKGWI